MKKKEAGGVKGWEKGAFIVKNGEITVRTGGVFLVGDA